MDAIGRAILLVASPPPPQQYTTRARRVVNEFVAPNKPAYCYQCASRSDSHQVYKIFGLHPRVRSMLLPHCKCHLHARINRLSIDLKQARIRIDVMKGATCAVTLNQKILEQAAHVAAVADSLGSCNPDIDISSKDHWRKRRLPILIRPSVSNSSWMSALA